MLVSVLPVRSPALAQSASEALAREHFERGFAAAQRGELELSISEFELAYRQAPHFSVLYNLGQAYASAGRAVEAVDTLERYLRLGGNAITESRRQQVAALIEYHGRRIGELTLEVTPPTASIALDGKAMGVAPLAPLRVTAGVHGLTVSAPGYHPHVASLSVKGRESQHLRITLPPVEHSAALELGCRLSDVHVELDGKARGRTPLAGAFPLTAGTHRLVLRRAGYRTIERRFEVKANQSVRIDCALDAEPDAPNATKLTVIHPVGTSVTVDGEPFDGRPLPAGRHQLTVAGADFETLERSVTLEPAHPLRLTLVPPPSGSAAARAASQRMQAQRDWSYLVGSVGLGAATAGGVLYWVNARRYDDWRAESRVLIADYARDPLSAPPERWNELFADEQAIRDRDAVALGLGVFGGTLLAAAAGLYLTARGPSLRLTVTAERSAAELHAVW
jgi:hypothetical protein